MLLKSKRGWELPESSATPESVFLARRKLVGALAAGPILAGAAPLLAGVARAAGEAGSANDPWAQYYPAERNPKFTLERDLTPEETASTYNNFFEFGSHKRISEAAQALQVRPWTVKIAGMVAKEMTIDFDDLLKQMPLEDRLYRHRCVEAWSMRVPYSGFPLSALVAMAEPQAGAKYVVMETLVDKDTMPGTKQFWYPWPYIEGLTLDEATNELAFIATGIYGKPIYKQHGAPLRLAVPWKYGFKHIKSIVSFTFTDTQPKSFWEELAANEYGFWANVNPDFNHPRWSQAQERDIGTGEQIPTQIYNGYGEFVASLYEDLPQNRTLFM